jgi:hypothetical protein
VINPGVKRRDLSCFRRSLALVEVADGRQSTNACRLHCRLRALTGTL